MSGITTNADRGEQGSALIIAVLISVILSLLGISYMLMGQTENVIAENERNSAMALYVAQAGARLAVNWLSDPSSTGYLVPGTGDVNRGLRLLDTDNDPSTPRLLASAGVAAKPIYKDGAITTSPLFDRPYRSALAETFLGIETGTDGDPNNATLGPDLVVNQAYLDTLNDTLFPNFPMPSLRAKIARIEFYSPPILSLGGSATRMGIATVKVIGGVFIYPGTAQERQIATRVVKATVNEIPLPGPTQPLQSCADLSYGGAFSIHWGTASSQGNAAPPGASQGNMDLKVNTGLPYALNDPFDYISGANTLKTWAVAHTASGDSIDDPWFKFIAGGAITTAASIPAPSPTSIQPWPFTWPGSTTADHSNMFQNTTINCPTFDYALWKSIAQSGARGNYYYTWDNNDQYRLDGTGTPTSWATLLDGKKGIFFFDTTNGQAPFGQYTDAQYPGTGSTTGYTNLTPGISISSASGFTGVVGFVYLNSKSFQTTGAGAIGGLHTVFPPGEPSDASGFVNLGYPGTLNGAYALKDNTVAANSFVDPETNTRFCVDAQACTLGGMTAAAAPVQDNIGLPFQDTVFMDGVFYTSGTFTANGNAVYFGSLVAQQGVLNGTGVPAFYFDESLIKGNWPRKGMNIPRVVITNWESGL